MYSYADRLRAVELYIRLGKRLNATIRQLGYPTKNALKGWYREHLDLRTQPVARAPKFSEAQKQAALEHYRTHDRCISSTMRALGYPGRGTLTAWVREAFPEARSSMVGRSWRRGYCDEGSSDYAVEMKALNRWLTDWASQGRHCTAGKISYSVTRPPHP
jgi:transposase-like protein